MIHKAISLLKYFLLISTITPFILFATPNFPKRATTGKNQNSAGYSLDQAKYIASKEEQNNLAAKKTKDQINAANLKLVENLMDLDYKVSSPPYELYQRSYTPANSHLPPVYFKSFYLADAFKAVVSNDINLLRALLNQSKFINGQNKDGDTILIHSINYYRLDIARLLLARGANIDAVNNRNRTALHYAAALGDFDLVKLLLSMGANFNLFDDLNMLAKDYAQNLHNEQIVWLISAYENRQKLIIKIK